MKKIAYFVHDLLDAAVLRRVLMLTAGGATVTPIGFRRSAAPIGAVEGIAVIDLGQTDDGKLARRMLSVAGALANIGSLADELRDVDTILARNLEMLVIAARVRKRYAAEARLVYECLDIHRLLFSRWLPGILLRQLESSLWREVDLLLTSSPAFIENYFVPRNFPSPIKLLENKVFLDDNRRLPAASAKSALGPPWRIGWFGILRCRKSLEILSSFARQMNGVIEVVLRGRPLVTTFPDFDATIAKLPHIRFGGPYRNPLDLSIMYGDVHFNWAIDYYEQGQNSSWLLPNRVYEGTLYSSVPIALAGVETSRWLADRGIGLVLEEPLEQKLVDFFRQLDQDGYAQLAKKVQAVPRRDLTVDRFDCRELVETLCRNEARASPCDETG